MAWTALVLELPAGREEDLLGAFVTSALGAQVEPLGRGRVRLRVYLASSRAAQAARETAVERLAALGLEAGPGGLRLEAVPDEHWVERYQASLRPFALGTRFTVLPAGPDPAATAGRQPILLTPGRAFGTGEHPTTRLSAEALERWVVPGSRWLDLGCGSAILSVVAVHCGACRVLAVDNDPEAIEVAREVVEANGVGRSCEVAHAGVEGAATACWDGIVANIGPAFFAAHSVSLARRLGRAGVLLASGFLVEQLAEIVGHVGAAGLEEVERRVDGPWALLVVRGRS